MFVTRALEEYGSRQQFMTHALEVTGRRLDNTLSKYTRCIDRGCCCCCLPAAKTQKRYTRSNDDRHTIRVRKPGTRTCMHVYGMQRAYHYEEPQSSMSWWAIEQSESTCHHTGSVVSNSSIVFCPVSLVVAAQWPLFLCRRLLTWGLDHADARRASTSSMHADSDSILLSCHTSCLRYAILFLAPGFILCCIGPSPLVLCMLLNRVGSFSFRSSFFFCAHFKFKAQLWVSSSRQQYGPHNLGRDPLCCGLCALLSVQFQERQRHHRTETT